MPPNHLYLIGYRGSGKTSVGRALAQRLQRPWFDSDFQIEVQAGQPVSWLFTNRGEEFFRLLESEVLSELATQPPSVISLGGGAVLRAANRNLLKNTGRCVWLRATAERLAARISADEASGKNRPSLTGAGAVPEIAQVLAAREPIYEAVSDWSIETEDQTPDQLAQQIADWYAQAQSRGK